MTSNLLAMLGSVLANAQANLDRAETHEETVNALFALWDIKAEIAVIQQTHGV